LLTKVGAMCVKQRITSRQTRPNAYLIQHICMGVYCDHVEGTDAFSATRAGLGRRVNCGIVMSDVWPASRRHPGRMLAGQAGGGWEKESTGRVDMFASFNAQDLRLPVFTYVMHYVDTRYRSEVKLTALRGGASRSRCVRSETQRKGRQSHASIRSYRFTASSEIPPRKTPEGFCAGISRFLFSPHFLSIFCHFAH
jgi:hypothetical protein